MSDTRQIKTLYDILPRPVYRFLNIFYSSAYVPLMRTISHYAFKMSRDAIKNQETLKALRGRHSGQRAFIIGNGPSLTVEDLNKIHANGDISFTSNNIWHIFENTDWRPTYYAVANDGLAHAKTKQMIDRAEARYKFLRTTNYLQVRKLSGDKLYLNVHGKGTIDNPRFAEDVSKVIYAMGTTTFVLIQLAVYMGCKELYIIGCDNSYSIIKTRDGKIMHTDNKSYFDAADKAARQVPIETWQMDLAYETAKQYADSHGIKICNAGRGGSLETFDRIDFDTLFP